MDVITGALAWIITHYRLLAIIAGLFIVLIVIEQIGSCRQANEQKRIEKLNKEIIEQQTITNIKLAEQANIEVEVKDAKANTNQAGNNFNKSLKKDSSAFDSSAAEDKYCSRWCEDSSCRDWRLKHPGFTCN